MKCKCGKEFKNKRGLTIHENVHCFLKQKDDNISNIVEIVESKEVKKESGFAKGIMVKHRIHGDRFQIEFITDDGRIARRVNARPEGIKFYKEKELELL